MLPNIILIGFMGSGKSSVGRRLAAATGHRFLDTDELVTEKAGCSISDIFAARGEEHFRDLETAALQDLGGVCGIILATGGGVVLRPENRRALHALGVVAWLDADPDIIFERVSRNQKRPLLRTEDPRLSFDTLLQSRRLIYEEAADFRLDTGGLSHDDAARRILDESLRFNARRGLKVDAPPQTGDLLGAEFVTLTTQHQKSYGKNRHQWLRTHRSSCLSRNRGTRPPRQGN